MNTYSLVFFPKFEIFPKMKGNYVSKITKYVNKKEVAI